MVLVAPEIPQNTGNIIRLCANTGARLHLVEPLGFSLYESGLRRASLDYTDLTDVIVHDSFETFLKSSNVEQVYGAIPDGPSLYNTPTYQPNDAIVFGCESIGLSSDIVGKLHPDNLIRIPMMPSNRSLNLSNAAAIIVYEMWRQLGFYGEGYEP